MTLNEGIMNTPYCIEGVSANEPGMKEFLFSLGCYPGEHITIISHLASNMIIHIKDARYSIDTDLARAIVV